jgi:hypothetical protein
MRRAKMEDSAAHGLKRRSVQNDMLIVETGYSFAQDRVTQWYFTVENPLIPVPQEMRVAAVLPESQLRDEQTVTLSWWGTRGIGVAWFLALAPEAVSHWRVRVGGSQDGIHVKASRGPCQLSIVEQASAHRAYKHVRGLPDELCGNRRGRVLHRVSCPYARMIRSGRKIAFSSPEEAVTQGFFPSCSCLLLPDPQR